MLVEIIMKQEHVDLWLNAADGKNSAEDWTTFFKKEVKI